MLASLLGASKVMRWVFVAALCLPAAGCNNILSQFANQVDDPSLLQAVTTAVNEADYATAISLCGDMSAAFLYGEGAYICASAYAGSCGYTMSGAVDDFTGFTGTPLLFEYAMEQQNGATPAKMAACEGALQILRGVGAAAARTDDQNFLLILSGLTHLGVILNTLADTNDDGTPDAGFDAADTNDMSVAQLDQFGRALWELYRSAEAVDSSITSDVKDALDLVSDAIDVVGTQYNFLDSAADPDAFTANQRRGICALIKEDDALGLSYCTDFPTCLVACP